MAEERNAADAAIATSASADPRIYFAAERTFLAWIRTGLGLMGVGFAVSRFGLFLREMRASEVHAAIHATGVSEYSGVALVAVGVAVNVTAVVQHIRTVRELREGSWIPGQVSTNAIALAGSGGHGDGGISLVSAVTARVTVRWMTLAAFVS
jgi:putative membrane protein